MTTGYAYLNEVAPFPDQPTPTDLAKHFAGRAQMAWLDIINPGGPDVPSVAQIQRFQGLAVATWLWRILDEAAPDVAAEAAEQIGESLQYGEDLPERLWEWLIDYGLDPERITPVRNGKEG